MSHLHFVANSVYRDRVIQMGERPDRVLVTGAPGLDLIRTTPPTPRAELEQRIGLKFASAPLLVTFHPTTLEYAATAMQVQALMAALAAVDRPILFTYPNADTAASAIIAAINDFIAGRANARTIKSLGTADYFGMMAVSAAMVGNSSSGIVEAPSFALPAVNIGNRQRGRLARRQCDRLPAGARRHPGGNRARGQHRIPREPQGSRQSLWRRLRRRSDCQRVARSAP